MRGRAVLFPLSTPKSPLLLTICNLPALFYFLARPWLQGKKDDHSRSNRYQSFCKLMVIELNWVKCNLVCIWSDGRTAWLKKKLVDEVFVISGVIKVIPWLFRISQKPNLIIVLLYIASKKITRNTLSQGWIDIIVIGISQLSASRKLINLLLHTNDMLI